jgi:hypothetical protein
MPVLTDPLGWFTLRVPEGWETETEDCVTTLKSPDGPGVVYLSGGRHARGRQRSFGGADFLARFLESLGVAVDPASIERSEGDGCRIYAYRRESDGLHWSYWSVTDDETALLVSYNCLAPCLGQEAGVVEELVRSVRLFHSAPVH